MYYVHLSLGNKLVPVSLTTCCFNVSPINFSKGKHEILPPGRNNPRHHDTTQANVSKAALQKWPWESWWTASWPWASIGPLQWRWPAASQTAFPAGQGRSSSSLLSTSDTPRSGMLCPVLGSPVQERQGLCGASPAKGYRDDEGTGASVIQGEIESCACSALVKRRLGGICACV